MLPTQPQLDVDGSVVPHDHFDILDADGIIRRVSKQHVVDDPKVIGGRKLSSFLFNPSSGINGGLSYQRPEWLTRWGFPAMSKSDSPCG